MTSYLMSNALYYEDVSQSQEWNLPWERLRNKSVVLSGGTGLIGSFFVDVLMYLNRKMDLNISVYVLCRNIERAECRFGHCLNDPSLKFIEKDITQELDFDFPCDYALHLASNTHPLAYSSDPIGTITTNVCGTKNMLDYAASHGCERFLLASSNEIYGENRGDTEFFDEKYCGYIDCNTLRACYTESKRCSESLCNAYIAQKGLDCVIARLTRTYGPTMRMDDSKAISQFIRNALNNESIVLKSDGSQFYSFSYVADAVQGILTVLLKGQRAQAYNIAAPSSDITLRELAYLVASICGVSVIFENPSDIERAGFSAVTKARLDPSKIKALGWRCRYPIGKGIERTLKIMGARIKC